MYKKIMLSLLLLPCMVVSNSDRDCQIEQLKNAQRDKEEEIALIMKSIDEKEVLIDSIVVKVQKITPNLGYEYGEELQEEMDCFESSLQEALMHCKSIESLLDYNFIKRSNKGELELERIKYLIIRYTLEYINLHKLIQQYKKNLQELVDLHCKLETLQK